MTESLRGTVLILASTFPSSSKDPVPAFVRDQVLAIHRAHPQLRIHVLAPHDRRSQTRAVTEHDEFVEHRFHYFWPRSAERLAGRGIMPALRSNPLLYFVVPFLFLGEYVAARRLVRKLQPDLIYAHWFTPQAVVASWLRVPFVFTTHASDVDVWHRVPLIGRRVVQSVARRARAISAVSTRSQAKLERFFAEGTAPTIEIIAMGVDLQPQLPTARERRAARAELGLGEGRVLLFIGRVVEKKGLTYLLDALVEVGSDAADLLLVAGDGPLLEEVRQRATELGIDERVRFLGYVTGNQKAACFRAADALVVPSIVSDDGDAEGLPVALLEGLASGLPCVATYESGADDIITDGLDGLLVPQRDAGALAKALGRLSQLSSREHASLRSHGHALSARYGWDEVARRHADLLFSPILGSRR